MIYGHVNWEGRGIEWSLSEGPIREFTYSNYEKPRNLSTDVYDSRYVSGSLYTDINVSEGLTFC